MEKIESKQFVNTLIKEQSLASHRNLSDMKRCEKKEKAEESTITLAWSTKSIRNCVCVHNELVTENSLIHVAAINDVCTRITHSITHSIVHSFDSFRYCVYRNNFMTGRDFSNACTKLMILSTAQKRL